MPADASYPLVEEPCSGLVSCRALLQRRLLQFSNATGEQVVAVKGYVMATRPSSSCSWCRYKRMNDVYSRGDDVPTVSLLDASACLLNSISSACAGSVLAACFDITPRLADRAGTSADKAGGAEFSGVWLPSPAQDAQSFFTGKRPTFSSPKPEVQSHHPWTSRMSVDRYFVF